MFIVAGYSNVSTNIRPCVLGRPLTIQTFLMILSQDIVLVEVGSARIS
jgi:hypothetical protein